MDPLGPDRRLGTSPGRHSRPAVAAAGAADDEAPEDGVSPATVLHPIDTVAAQHRRRREASRRMPPRADGCRDPWDLRVADGRWTQ
jgi:hypothetical protein